MNLARFEAHKATLRELYVDNETDTDEYREAQPHKGLRHIAWALGVLGDDETVDEGTARRLMALGAAWLDGYTGGYSAAAECAAALTLVFDVLWAHGEHPYSSTEEELAEYLELM